MAKKGRATLKRVAGRKRKADALYESDGFIIENPRRPPTPKRSAPEVQSAPGSTSVEDDPGVKDLKICFNVKPGTAWKEMRRYSNVRCKYHTRRVLQR
jgi:hypothetical protein